jgi:phosphodiesterase/alkaline phosphatase D-like protein
MLRKAFILLLWSAFALAQNQVRITQGPKVEHTDATTAIIAWSTDVSSGTQVKYGSDPNNLTQQAGMPWGGFTHRVTLKNLKPNTTYFFQAISGQAQGSGTTASSDIAQFQTTDQTATSAPTASEPNQQSPPANPPN